MGDEVSVDGGFVRVGDWSVRLSVVREVCRRGRMLEVVHDRGEDAYVTTLEFDGEARARAAYREFLGAMRTEGP